MFPYYTHCLEFHRVFDVQAERTVRHKPYLTVLYQKGKTISSKRLECHLVAKFVWKKESPLPQGQSAYHLLLVLPWEQEAQQSHLYSQTRRCTFATAIKWHFANAGRKYTPLEQHIRINLLFCAWTNCFDAFLSHNLEKKKGWFCYVSFFFFFKENYSSSQIRK